MPKNLSLERFINIQSKLMAMKESIYRLALLSLIIVGLACFSSVASASAVSSASGSPTLENAGITPENGPWGSTFTFTVTYTEANGFLPAPEYPKLYLDNTAMVMEENNPADNDVTDGKVYFENWTPVKENIGPHNFYFYVETPSGENARTPAADAYEVLWVTRPMSLSCEVDNPEPAVGETITFSGYLRTADDNLGKAGENITLYKIFLDNDTSMVSATTENENGYFKFSLGAPGPEISCYIALFPGDNYYDTSASSILYSSTLNKSLVFGGYVAVLMVLIGIGMFLLPRGITRADYLMPVLIGFVLGFFLLLIGAAELSVLAAGLITGYLFAKTAPKWTKNFRIGCITGLLFLLAIGLISAYYIIALPPEALGVIYSVTQMEIFTSLFTSTIFSLLYYSVLVGMGAVVGGMLRKILKPGEQKPPSGSGETTSSGVEQQ
jgi:hypothetical protein